MKIKILVDNRTNDYRCRAEHGLSLYIQTPHKNILFDTGASSLFVENSQILQADLDKVDGVVISHGHYDHGGGIEAFCKKNRYAPIYIHNKAFGESFGTEKGKMEEEDCGLPRPESEVFSRCHPVEEPLWLDEHTVVSGTIPTVYGDFSTETFYRRKEREFEKDPMDHEQFLAIRTEKGIVLFSGCSHKGIEPALAYGKTLFPGVPIYAVFAGLHLMGATEERLDQVSQFLLGEKIQKVIPLHCTGAVAACELKNRLKERCILSGVGDCYEY